MQRTPQRMSLLEQRRQKDLQQQQTAYKKVEEMTALNPTEEEVQLSDQIIRSISEKHRKLISDKGFTTEVQNILRQQIDFEVDALEKDYERRNRLKKIVSMSIFGLGPLEPYMQEGSPVTDILVHNYKHICIEDDTGMHRVDAAFNSEAHLINVIQRIVQRVGRTINLATPYVDAKLEDGSRIHATIPPITPDGATLTIRRFNTQKLEGEDYLRLGTMTPPMLDFLVACIQSKVSMLVSGGTGAGKTTLLNMLSNYIPKDEIIVTIEDNCELQLKQPNVRRMEARQGTSETSAVTIQDLVRMSLRMRPDRIVVGEVRDGTVVDMLTAMGTGHPGSMSTVHADSPRALVDSRLPILFSQNKDASAISTYMQMLTIAQAVKIIVQIFRDDNKRRITYISMVDGIDESTNAIKLIDIFRYEPNEQRYYVIDKIPEELTERFRQFHIPVPNLTENTVQGGIVL